MKDFLFIPTLLLTLLLQGQHSISGTFLPAEEYTWLIAYHLKGGTQEYIADTAIKDGKFEMIIPANSPTGNYRLVYAVPQEEFNFDILYTGKEDLQLTFNSEEGAVFSNSQENILFNTYFKEIQDAERRLILYYANGSTDRSEFEKITESYLAVQHSFAKKSEGLIVQNFIEANEPYIPSTYETVNQYVKNRKERYFDALDITNPVLQASGFLTDKLANYVFTALPVEQMTDEEIDKIMEDNVKTVVKKLNGTSENYQFSILNSIWIKASANNLNDLSDFIFSEYLKSRATTPENQKIVAEIELQNRLRLGSIAPEISWKDEENPKSLSKLEGFENYVLVFWSSTCGHCLRELPALHKRLKDKTDLKVIAIGLEDDNKTWKVESEKLDAFEHVIALGKWDSEYAHLYGIDSTPTYFILDKEKRIIEKPESDKMVIAYLEKE